MANRPAVEAFANEMRPRAEEAEREAGISIAATQFLPDFYTLALAYKKCLDNRDSQGVVLFLS